MNAVDKARRDHELAWSDNPSESIASHNYDPNLCAGCNKIRALIAAVRAECASEGRTVVWQNGPVGTPALGAMSRLANAAQDVVAAWADDESGMETFDPALIDRLALVLREVEP